MSSSLRSRRVGSVVELVFGSVTMTPMGPTSLYDFAAFDLVLRPAKGIHAGGRTMHPIRRFLRQLHFREDAARSRIPTREVDARGLAYEAASTVAPDEILRVQ